MSYGFVFAPADVSIELTKFAKLYENNNFIKEAYDEVAKELTFPKSVLFSSDKNNLKMPRVKLVSISLLALMVGVSRDVENKLHEPPLWAGGVSLGELAAAVNAESISLSQAAQLLLDREDSPHGESESVAFIFLPAPLKSDALPTISNVWLSVDYGEIAGGVGSMLMLSGTRKGLAKLASKISFELDILPPELCSAAYHSPLREHVKLFIEKALNDIPVRTPRNPILSCIGDLGICADASSVVSSLSRSEMEQLSVSKLVSAASESAATEVFCIGPYLRSMEFPFTQSTHYIDEVSQYDVASVVS